VKEEHPFRDFIKDSWLYIARLSERNKNRERTTHGRKRRDKERIISSHGER